VLRRWKRENVGGGQRQKGERDSAFMDVNKINEIVNTVRGKDS